MSEISITVLEAEPAIRDALSALLIETVAGGASVSFMHPVSPQAADAFWGKAMAAATRGERVLFGAFDGESLVGTVTLLLDCADNQPHRCEIAKMMTRMSHRGRGVARTLMLAAEQEAIARGRTLMVLDTASDGGAGGFYEGLGYILAGEIPDYAFKPHGGLSGTRIYWKRLA